MNKIKLPMRDGVGVIILNKKNEVFVGKRKDNPIDKWQMPQGGIDDGENYVSAMKRELLEETSIKNIKILKEIDGFFEYQLPNNLIGIIFVENGNHKLLFKIHEHEGFNKDKYYSDIKIFMNNYARINKLGLKYIDIKLLESSSCHSN